MIKLMVTAASSNSGKTAVTCGLLALLKKRGLDPCAFKCGPDYIDPMFHRSVLGIPSFNLDVFLAGEDGVKDVFDRFSKGHGAAVCEGVMGYYDGIRISDGEGSGDFASAYHVSELLEIPAVLVVRPKGAALTLAAVIKGVAEFRENSRICGVIFNDCSEMYCRMYGPEIEKASGIPVLGYLPHMDEAGFESRHLGLMTAEEIEDLAGRIDRIGQKMEETIDVDRLLKLAGIHSDREDAKTYDAKAERSAVPIAVARDEAFNFIYAQTIEALEREDAEILYFSPLRDEALPAEAKGLYLPGGYPELYGQQLADNESMRRSIREAVEAGLPTIAECGGFLYLSSSLADTEGKVWPMCAALPGDAANAGRLVRFGYGYISSDEDTMLIGPGDRVPVHEFHYWDTTAGGDDLTLTKASNGRTWNFGYAGSRLYAGFPHLYIAGGKLAQKFVETCRK